MRLQPAFDQITNAMEDLNEARGRPVGNLRVYVSSTAAADVVAPIWKCFLSTYPEVNLEVRSARRRSISSPRGSMPGSDPGTAAPSI